MARLMKYNEIGRIEYEDKILSFNREGKTLVNYGQGWKLWQYDKHTDLSPTQRLAFYQNDQKLHNRKHPRYADYVKQLHSLVASSYRSEVTTIIHEFFLDPDIAYAEYLNRHQYSGTAKPRLTEDDITLLCSLYLLYDNEIPVQVVA
jgi:hypothetical protein